MTSRLDGGDSSEGWMDAAVLLDKIIPPMRYVFDGLVPEGLGVLGAPPKSGKSLLAYQMSVAAATGTNLLGRHGEQRPVLYYALEDGERRSQDRIRAALAGRTLPKRRLLLMWTAPPLGGPLEEEVAGYLDDRPDALVIIDVLSRVRPPGSRGGRNLNAYDEDYALLTDLHAVAKAHVPSSILLITHDRKAGSDDWVTRVTGTRGVTGAADYLLFIDRKRGEMTGYISASGRDLADLSLAVRFTGDGWEPATMTTLIGAASPVRQTIFQWLAEYGPAHGKAIAAGTGLTETVVYHRLPDMVEDGQLEPCPLGYRVPEE